MHLVQQLKPVTEVEMVGTVENFEFCAWAESLTERRDTGVKIYEDIVFCGDDQARHRIGERKLARFEGTAADEGFRHRREAAKAGDSRIDGGHLERRPAAIGVAKRADRVFPNTRECLSFVALVDDGTDHSREVRWPLGASSQVHLAAGLLVRKFDHFGERIAQVIRGSDNKPPAGEMGHQEGRLLA